MKADQDILAFSDRTDWRSWLRRHHTTKTETWLVIRKKHAPLPGLSLDEAVEEALCFGWIDGKLHTRNSQSYLLRFSPRRPDSVWSLRNIRRVGQLQRRGAMTEAGLRAVRNARENGQWQSAIEREDPGTIPPDLASALRRKKGATAAYRELPDSQKKQYLYWLQSAKRDATRRKRIIEIVRLTCGEL